MIESDGAITGFRIACCSTACHRHWVISNGRTRRVKAESPCPYLLRIHTAAVTPALNLPFSSSSPCANGFDRRRSRPRPLIRSARHRIV
jgi:hypothetical protein